VFRRSCPKFESHELVRSTGQRSLRGTILRALRTPGLVSVRRFAQTTSSSPFAMQRERTVEMAEPRSRCSVPMSSRCPRLSAASSVGANRLRSCRLAASAAHPVGMP
jgi:hypothetical protein